MLANSRDVTRMVKAALVLVSGNEPHTVYQDTRKDGRRRYKLEILNAQRPTAHYELAAAQAHNQMLDTGVVVDEVEVKDHIFKHTGPHPYNGRRTLKVIVWVTPTW